MAERRRPGMGRFAVAASGSLMVVIGLILLPLPGPGTVLVLGGLSLLQREYPWAGRMLERIQLRSGFLAAWIRAQAGRTRRKR